MSRASAKTATAKISVTDGDTPIVLANPGRGEVTITNVNATAGNLVYLSLGGTATLNTGIRLNGAGGSTTISNYTGAISGIATSNPIVVAVAEI